MGYGLLLLGYASTINAYPQNWMTAVPVVGAILCCIGLWRGGRYELFYRIGFYAAIALGLLDVINFMLAEDLAGKVFSNIDALTNFYTVAHMIVYLLFNLCVLIGIIHQAKVCELPAIGQHAKLALALLGIFFVLNVIGAVTGANEMYLRITLYTGLAFYLLTLAAVFRCFNRMKLS